MLRSFLSLIHRNRGAQANVILTLFGLRHPHLLIPPENSHARSQPLFQIVADTSNASFRRAIKKRVLTSNPLANTNYKTSLKLSSRLLTHQNKLTSASKHISRNLHLHFSTSLLSRQQSFYRNPNLIVKMASYCDVQSAISQIKQSLAGKKLALFLDFDGTLAEIQTIPDNTYMTKDMTNILKKLSNLDQILTVAISGRQIDDLQKRIGLEELVYSGNHGLELNMDGSTVTYCLNQERVDLLRAAIKNIVHELREKKLGKECGGNIEEKDTALTWHFFNVPENKAENIVKQAAKIVEKYGFPISDGAGCIEVHDPTITKGDAIKKILNDKIGSNWHETHSVIFIGDSSSDEKGYATLCADSDFKHDHVTFIRILDNLRTPTKGNFIFSGTEDVYSLLSALYDFYSQ